MFSEYYMMFTELGFGNLKHSSQGQSPTFNLNVLSEKKIILLYFSSKFMSCIACF
jgi:hypothetical protein